MTTGSERERRLAELADRTAIVETTHRMAACFDQLDWTGLAACFRDEVRVRYGYVLGDGRRELSAAAFVERWRSATAGLETTYHLLANHRVDLARGDRDDDGDGRTESATCAAYCLVQHYYPEPSGGCTWTLGGHYDFGFERTDEGWRIAVLELSTLWARGNRHLVEGDDRSATPDEAEGVPGRPGG
jgi:hypothetical protein